LLIGFDPFLCAERIGARLRSLGLARCCTRLNRSPVIHADHHGDESRFFVRQTLLQPFAKLALALVDQSDGGADLTDDTDFRGFGICLLEAISEPGGHGVADHDTGLRRLDFRLLRRWRMGGRRLPGLPVSGHPRRGLPEPWVAEELEAIAAKAIAAVLGLRRLPKRRTGEDQHAAQHARAHRPAHPTWEHGTSLFVRFGPWPDSATSGVRAGSRGRGGYGLSEGTYASNSSLMSESMMNSVNKRTNLSATGARVPSGCEIWPGRTPRRVTCGRERLWSLPIPRH